MICDCRKENQSIGRKDLNHLIYMVLTAKIPEAKIKMPAILLAQLNPLRSSFFLKSVTPELSARNHNDDPINIPATSADEEKIVIPFVRSNVAKTAMKAKIVEGFVSVIPKLEIYDLTEPLLLIASLGSLGFVLNVFTPIKRSSAPPRIRIRIRYVSSPSEIAVNPNAAIEL